MKLRLPFIMGVLVVGLGLGGCASTPAERIGRNRVVFDQFPMPVQEKIRAGQVEVGFTESMVLIALGKPDRKFTHKTKAATEEIWSYHDRKPQFGFGLGLGTAGGSTAYGGSVGVATGGNFGVDALRVVFREGVVTSVEDRVK
ncbi:MAG: hypothetical protein PHQ04_08060 [Opitutaceae bacterium]|nr:hypothetical protein [Opitutaceae bacterium]